MCPFPAEEVGTKPICNRRDWNKYELQKPVIADCSGENERTW